MARYYAGVHGNRGEATRLGSPASGMSSWTNGWHIGLSAYASPEYENPNQDEIEFSMTSGSSNSQAHHLGTIVETDNGPQFKPSQYVIDLCKGLTIPKET